ncbi:MAG: DUF2235 domain-containing protein [Cyclobacteriaceae bacterium]
MKSKPTTYKKDFGAIPIPRKHIILMDGTWNDESGTKSSGLVTNIVHLKDIFRNDDGSQIVRYHRGVGNDNDNSFWFQILRGMAGKGVEEIVENAYYRFVQDWRPGDEIFIFGFSRGAAAARMLAAQIEKLGVPEEITITLRAVQNRETRVVENKIDHVNIAANCARQKVEIEFLGVWDTVSAFGFWNNLLKHFKRTVQDHFSNYNVASNVKKAVHIVGIDETRNTFKPALMNMEDKVTEVWFPGVHSDIGGSYVEDELAKLSLDFMLKTMLKVTGKSLIEFDVNESMLSRFTINFYPRIIEGEKPNLTNTVHFHYHGYGFWSGKSLRNIRVIKKNKKTTLKPKVHKLYSQLAKSAETVAVTEKKKWRSSKVIVRKSRFQYLPINVKALGEPGDGFEVVE